MRKTFRLALFLAVALLVTLQTASIPHLGGPKTSLVLKPCTVPDIKGDAKCGTFEVFENRATRKGRKINLNALVLPATGSKSEAEALFFFGRGPVSAATEEASVVAQMLAKVREQRDLVFVDQRGTGKSNPLNCQLVDPSDPQSYLGSFYPIEATKKRLVEARTR